VVEQTNTTQRSDIDKTPVFAWCRFASLLGLFGGYA
jgi:hypothetical protein